MLADYFAILTFPQQAVWLVVSVVMSYYTAYVIVGFDEMAAFYEWKPLRAVIPLLMFSACGILFWTVARIILELMMAGKSA